MKQGWRWYGDADAITLKEIRQAGVTDIVAALYERRPGEVWPVAEIRARAKKVKDAGMTWSVVESVPVHEDIKKRTGDYLKYVANYKQTLRNLAKCGIKTVCYNFMPVLDWTRSNLTYALADGSTCLEYNEYELAGFDLFYLKRPGAEKEYDAKTRARAKRTWAKLDKKGRKRVADSVLCGLPGTVDDLTPAEFLAQLRTYDGIDDRQLRENMYWFLNEISPVLEETGVDTGSSTRSRRSSRRPASTRASTPTTRRTRSSGCRGSSRTRRTSPRCTAAARRGTSASRSAPAPSAATRVTTRWRS